jgi:hypothetical protein
LRDFLGAWLSPFSFVLKSAEASAVKGTLRLA